jgi:sigma-B regulation protein RsbU (phosphoserine phosphatase)
VTDQVAAMLRGQLTDIIGGSVFLFIGFATWSVATFRRRSGVRIFVWLGLWSAMYGAAQLSQSPAVVTASPRWLQMSAPYANTAMTYLLVVAGSLSFFELSLDRIHVFMLVAACAGLAIAVAGVALFIGTGANDIMMPYNNLLATGILFVLTTVVAVPRLARKYLVLPDRGVLAVGTFAFAVEALSTNVFRPFGFRSPRILDHLGFAVLLFSFGYAALRLVFANERRLLAVENELEIAREIQISILPNSVPEMADLRISAAYCPMTAVAGDFYDFIPVDQKRVGILVADVSGHGVPAALIASMIKVAMQSVVPCAHDPRSVLRGLNRALAGQLRSRLVSAAYLWLDTENRTGLYSAAGHPPLLRWRQGALERIESNGYLLGMIQTGDDYPVCAMGINRGDRFLLYTDGVTESENARGDFFGDSRLEEVVRNNQGRPPSVLSDELLSETARWRAASIPQQDDITLVVIDVDGPAADVPR